LVQYPRLGRAEPEFKSRQPHSIFMKKLASLSRTIYAIDGGKRLIKIYSSVLPVLFLDFSRMVLSVISLKPQIDFVDIKTRISNELMSRKKIKIPMPRIHKYSFNERFLVEDFVKGVSADKFLERPNLRVSRELGRFIGRLHKQNISLVDNRPKNYIINSKKVFRVDLELFRTNASEFDKMCDLVSFVESFDDERIRGPFLDGHAMLCNCSYNAYIGMLCKLFLKATKYLDG
jgi:hypothetical protein